DCPRGYTCQQGEEKNECIMNTFCNKNEDCPYTFKCDDGICVKQKGDQITQIFWELPWGQMIEKGLGNREKINELKTTVDSFSRSLMGNQLAVKEIKEKKFADESKTLAAITTQGIEPISNLAKALKSLTDNCNCENTEAICQKPQNFGQPQDCQGDPCDPVRGEINNLLEKLRRRKTDIVAHKKKFEEIKNKFEEEARKYRLLIEKILEDCKYSGLINRKEYFDTISLIQQQGGKTELNKIYWPKNADPDDPLTFFCSVGGNIYDYPYPSSKFYEELKPDKNFSFEPIKSEPLSCVAQIPFGSLVEDMIENISYGINQDLENLIYFITKLEEKIIKMNELISQCNDSRCKANCSCIQNPCYLKCGICSPLWCICFPFCFSPCLQTLGVCQGEPCPREDLGETVELIKKYENELLRILERIENNLGELTKYLTFNKEYGTGLAIIRQDFAYCLSLTTKWRLTEKPEEGSFWGLLRCEEAIGQKGPDGRIINSCHPQDLFCCTNKPSVEKIKEFSTLARKIESTIVQPKEEIYSPVKQGSSNVPYFSQKDPRWRNKDFGCGKTIGEAGCGPTTIAMALNFLGIKTDPPTVADWVLKKGYRVCGSGTAHAACCAAVKEFGKGSFKCEELHGKTKEVLEMLKDGRGVIIADVSGRGPPPYTKGGHYVVLTGVEKEWDEFFVNYNDPAFDPLKPEIRPAQSKLPIDWFEKLGIRAGCVIYKE
ncbi:MAG: C39 family peptidase, partial [candidate division WOR-3 bacterium]